MKEEDGQLLFQLFLSDQKFRVFWRLFKSIVIEWLKSHYIKINLYVSG